MSSTVLITFIRKAKIIQWELFCMQKSDRKNLNHFEYLAFRDPRLANETQFIYASQRAEFLGTRRIVRSVVLSLP